MIFQEMRDRTNIVLRLCMVSDIGSTEGRIRHHAEKRLNDLSRDGCLE